MKSDMNQQTPTTEVARLREELDRFKLGFQGSCYACEPVGEMNHKLEAEVARLRALLNRAIEIAERLVNGACGEWGCIGHTDEVDKYGKELTTMKAEARLAPAPEELVSDWKCPHCGSTAGTWFSRVEPMGDFCEDCGKAVDEEPAPAPEEPTIKESLTTEPAPEWRELGPDEVIQEGDECRHKVQYEPVMDTMIGGDAELFKFYRFRTRRPLPKQEPLFPPIHPKQVLTPEERTEQLKHNSEVARLKEMVMDAARRGDEMAAHWQERAEKAEAIIKQLHHYAGIVEGFQNANK